MLYIVCIDIVAMLHDIYVYKYIWYLVALDVHAIKAALCIYECTHSPSFLYMMVEITATKGENFCTGVRRDEHFIYTIVGMRNVANFVMLRRRRNTYMLLMTI